MKLSFILLSYNQCEKVLNCIDSIVLSGIPDNDYEIIVVDDGSSDNTVNIVNLKFNKFNNIKTTFTNNGINTRNQSLGRNIGIKMAKGEYIRFVDGDDYFDSYSIYLEYSKYLMNSKYDMLFTDYLVVNTISDIITHQTKLNPTMFGGIANYYVKTEILIKNEIYFDEIKFNWFFEDLYFFVILLECIISKNYTYNKMDDIKLFASYVCIKMLGTNSCVSNMSDKEFKIYSDILIDLFEFLSNIKINNIGPLLIEQETMYYTYDCIDRLR